VEIQFQNVAFSYESRKKEPSVSGLNFTIHSGEFILICGSSGSGKSTVGRIMNGLVPGFYRGELTGTVLLDGVDISSIPQVELAGSIGSVFQNPRTQFFDTDSTGELAFGCENMGFHKKEILKKIYTVTETFGIESLLNRDIFELSGGEKQKIACGSIYAVNPDVYVFDEPSSNLDLGSIKDLAEIMRKLKAEGKTIILIEHRIHYAAFMADRVFYMDGGRITKIFENEEFVNLDKEVLHRMGLRFIDKSDVGTVSTERTGSAIQDAIRVESLGFRYKQSRRDDGDTLDIHNLSIPSGQIIALIGENGAGKSTFVKCMCGLVKGEKASIKDSAGKLLRKQRLRDSYLVMQDVNHQLFAESVEAELLLSAPDLTKEQIATYLSDLDLSEFANDHPMSLSGGQKQRVAVAAACVAKKKYLYLDEPTSGLDYIQMKNMSKTIRKAKEKVAFVLVITHDPEFIMECCDYVMEFTKGKVKRVYPLSADGVERLCEFFPIE